MAEVIGAASAIAGLISLTIEVSGITYNYVHGVRNASSSAHRLLRELDELKIVLIKIGQMTEEADDTGTIKDSCSRLLSTQQSENYLDLLDTIRKKLGNEHGGGSFRKKMKALAWPITEEKTLALVDSLHRHLNTYNTALAIDNLTVGTSTLSEVRQVKIKHEDARIEAVLDWLSPLNMFQKQQDILSRRHGDTGSWLLSKPVFQRWVNSESSHRTLWCPGDPGTGKTVITSIVVDHLVRNFASEDIRIAYVYCDYKDQAMQTCANLLACLARQLIGRPKNLPLQLEKLHQELEQQRRRPNLEELKRLLVASCNERERTYIIVDALDECEAMHERRLFLPLLQTLPFGSTRLFVTSRPNNEDIYHVFATAAQINIAAPVSEVERFVTEKMDERMEFIKRITQELREEIIATISARASGMFLLAVLQIDRICVARTIKRIKIALNSMPTELDDLYRETLDRIKKQPGDDSELGMRVLSWVTHARRPLSVEELRHGLAVEYDEDEEPPGDLDEDNLLSPRSLLDVCAGLVIIDPRSQIIRLVHYTTQEYFDKERQHLFREAEVDISRACLTYLSYGVFDSLSSDENLTETMLHSHHFLQYASLYWVSHVNASKKNGDSSPSPVQLQAVAYVQESSKFLFSTMVLRKMLLRPRSYARVTDLYPGSRREISPFEAAVECGLQELASFLLARRVYSAGAMSSALNYASSEGHADMTRMLLERGAEVESMAGSSNALQKACKGGHFEVAKILLENGANANSFDRWKWTPLHHAAHGGHSSLVALLLENAADPNAQSPLGLTACHIAASIGDTDTIVLLLDNKHDLKRVTRDKHTPLHEAAEGGHLSVIRLLLQRGVDVQAKTLKGQSAWDMVPEYASKEIRGAFAPYLEASFGDQNADAHREIPVEHASSPDEAPSNSSDVQVLYENEDDILKKWRQVFTPASTDEGEATIATANLPWAVPHLRLVMPTPPSSPAESLDDDLSAQALPDMSPLDKRPRGEIPLKEQDAEPDHDTSVGNDVISTNETTHILEDLKMDDTRILEKWREFFTPASDEESRAVIAELDLAQTVPRISIIEPT